VSGAGELPDGDLDLLAAEYVLGTLGTDEARRAEELMVQDAAFRASVQAWERRLAPLASLVPPREPPSDLWSRIEASTTAKSMPSAAGPAPREPWRRQLAAWRVATVGSLALAAAIAAFAVLREPARPTPVAVLAAPDSGPVFIAEAVPDGLQLHPAGAVQVAAGKDLELWEPPAGSTRPQSLGVLPAAGRTITAPLPPGTQLLVSLEPQGGSPTGQPTGPVILASRGLPQL
jgi:anti-sigma-K factor RskA